VEFHRKHFLLRRRRYVSWAFSRTLEHWLLIQQ